MANKTRASARTPTIPKEMRAAAIDRFGPPSVLKTKLFPVPTPGQREVLIQVHTAGVGIWDAQIRSGDWAEGDEQFPLILGTDGSGHVVAAGSRVRKFEIGERVWAYQYDSPNAGFYAEYVAVDAKSVGRVPDQLTLLEAGAAAVTGLTALQGVDDHLRIKPRETLLIFGATGAVGTLAVQFAKRRRARVVATATGAKATALVEKLGAEIVFDARNSAELERLDEIVPGGVDAVLAFAGGDALQRCLDLVHSRGRVAFPNGIEPEPKRLKRHHLFRIIKYDAAVGRSQLERLSAGVTESKLEVQIAAAYPLMQAAQAHRRVERGGGVGRVVLRIRRQPD